MITGVESILPIEAGFFNHLWQTVINFVPDLIIAILVWIVSWALAKILKQGAEYLLHKIGLDRLAEKANVNTFLRNANLGGSATAIIANIVYWFVYLFGISIVFEILGLRVISDLVNTFIEYIPNLFVAVLIVLVGAFVAKFVKHLTDGATATTQMSNHSRLGHVVYIIIMLFAIVTALKQAQVDISFLTDNINTIVMGIMLALGLAFGLGGKEKAQSLIEKYLK